MSFSGRRKDDLIELIKVGAVLTIDVSGWSKNDIIDVIAQARSSERRIILRGLDGRGHSDLLTFAQLGGGFLQMEG